ncbi:trinucleotide repeat-containing gene 6B protein-like, partial [Diretmus argenteus]
FYNSKVSHLLPGPQESPLGGNSSGVPGANFNPNTNPSAWPALVQGGTSASASEVIPLHASITSASPFSASTTLITTHSLSSVNQAGGARSGEQQQHWGGLVPELGSGGGAIGAGPGPNQEGGDGMDYGVGGEGSSKLSGSLSSSSAASSSWRTMPPTSSDLSTGASQTDGWSGDGAGAQGKDGNVWGSGSQGEKPGWGRGNDGSSNTPVVSQGAWEGESSEPEWTGTAGGGGSGNLAIGSGRGGGGSSNSSSSGGSGGVGGGVSQDTASPTFATMSRAWDNQKGVETVDGGASEWGGGGGGQGGGRGGGGPSSSSRGGSLAGSGGGVSGGGPHNQKPEHSSGSHPPLQTPNAEVALQSMLSRSDLDPRVLSNTGWGQTQIRQNVAWDLDTTKGGGNRNERNTSSSSVFSSSSSMNTTTSRGPGYPSNTSSITTDPSTGVHKASLNSAPASMRDDWDGGATQPARGPHVPGNTIRKPGSPMEDKESNQGNVAGGWGDLPPESQGKGWGCEQQERGDHRGGGNWRDTGEQGSGWGGGAEDKGAGGWKEMGRGEAGSWGAQRGGGGNWGQRDSKPGGGWGDGRSRGGSNSDEGSSWGNVDEGGSQKRAWAGGDVGGGKPHQDWGNVKPHPAAAAQIPNSQVATMKAPNQQQHQSQGQQPQGGWGSRSSVGDRGAPPSKNQNQSSGWTAGPIPQVSGGGSDPLESSGWEEPSPQSISRKMEIDDGTSAWGDPTRYNSKNVNLWDKNNAPPGQGHSQQGPPQSMQQQPPRRQQAMQPSRDTNTGNAAMGPGMWGGGAPSADNGTTSWGQQTSEAPTVWGDSDEPGKASGWGNPSTNPGKPGSKSMEGWGGKGEASVAASRHSSWEEEDDGGGGVWNNAGSQGSSSSSYNAGGWGQSHGGKRRDMKGGGGDNWMNPMSRQFSNMGLLGDDPNVDKKMEADKRGMNDYNGEIRRGGRGGGGYRMPSSKELGAVDMGSYGEKMGGHGVFGGSGAGMPQPRGMHQPGMHPMNPSQGLRAQVPHPYLSAQVPGPVLKQMPSPAGSVGGVVGGVGGVGSVGGVSGVGGGVFPPQLSPQQLAMLSNIYPHVQQFHL